MSNKSLDQQQLNIDSEEPDLATGDLGGQLQGLKRRGAPEGHDRAGAQDAAIPGVPLASRNLPVLLYRVHCAGRGYGTGWEQRLAAQNAEQKRKK